VIDFISWSSVVEERRQKDASAIPHEKLQISQALGTFQEALLRLARGDG
jgi:hypothetical protein